MKTITIYSLSKSFFVLCICLSFIDFLIKNILFKLRKDLMQSYISQYFILILRKPPEKTFFVNCQQRIYFYIYIIIIYLCSRNSVLFVWISPPHTEDKALKYQIRFQLASNNRCRNIQKQTTINIYDLNIYI